MKEFYLLDNNGFYAGTTLLPDDTQDTATCVSVSLPTGLYKCKFDAASQSWVEGATADEIAAAKAAAAIPTDSDRIALLEAAVDALLMGGVTNG